MTDHTPHVLAAWAEASNTEHEFVIGHRATNSLPWGRHAADLAYFAATTADRVLVMTRATFQSLPASMKTREALSKRPMLVMTAHEHFDQTSRLTVGEHGVDARPYPYDYPGLETPADVLEYVAEVWPGRNVAVIGGAKVIEHMAPLIDEFHVTGIEGMYAGDVPAPALAVLRGCHLDHIEYLTRGGTQDALASVMVYGRVAMAD